MEALRTFANGTAAAIHVLVAACDTHTHSSGHSNSSGSPPVTPRDSIDTLRDSVTSITKQRGVNASRDRMKQEMQQLRDSVEELQRQLDELKRDHNRRVPDEMQDHTGIEDPSAKQLAVAWEAMARGQCEQRYRAEVENVKLRKMLDEQIKVAQTLERILSKRRGTDSFLEMCKPRTKRPRTAMCPIDRPNLFSDLELGLPSLYSQVDAVLRKENFLRRLGEPFRDIDVRHSDEIGSYVEATERRLIPFAHDDVAQSTWEYLVTYPEATHLNDPSQRLDTSLNVVRGDIDIVMQLTRFTGHVHAKYVARRFVERDRIIIVWVAVVDPSEMADAAIDGIVLRHTGWICSRPASLQASDSQVVMTEYLTAHLSVPEVYDEMFDRKRRLATLTNFLVSSITYQLDGNKRNLDNSLLEHALSKSKMTRK